MTYLPRLIDKVISEHLETTGAVIIEGPRFCGKTETASQHAASILQLDTDLRSQSPAIASLLEGDSPRLIDEWQLVPEIWNLVRREVDKRKTPGQFILTGSAAPEFDANRHSGAGRFQRLKMRTMTLSETGYSNSKVSLSALFDGTQQTVESEFGFDALLTEIVRGGWPALQNFEPSRATARLVSYIQDTIQTDYSLVDPSIRTPERLGSLIRSIARNTGSPKKTSLYAADLGEGSPANVATIESYFEILRRLHLLDLVPGSSWKLRSRETMRSKPRVYLTDPSLAVAAIGATTQALKNDLNTLGFLFENLVVRDLITYASMENGSVSYYRDSSELEVDAILKLWDGRWAAIEIKLGERGSRSSRGKPAQAEQQTCRRPRPASFLSCNHQRQHQLPSPRWRLGDSPSAPRRLETNS
jgi:uncharacterized protein